MSERILMGIPVAPGIAIGKVFRFRHDLPEIREISILEGQRQTEVDRFSRSLDITRKQLASLRDRVAKIIGESVARIFEAQLTILEDEQFTSQVRSAILKRGMNAEAIVSTTTDQLYQSFEGLEDELFRQRAQDIRDVGHRLISNLMGHNDRAYGPVDHPCILVADNLLPSDVVHFMRDNVLAVVTDEGEATSHTAILTRSLEVPAIVGLEGVSEFAHNNQQIIVNGNSGKVILDPLAETLDEYSLKRSRYQSYVTSLRDIEQLPAETLDGHRINLCANIELPNEAKAALAAGGEGIGLFRSEYLVLVRNSLPDEDDQYRDYVEVIRAIAPYPVTIRTYDLGGDKIFPDIPHPYESNPFMGWRAIRVGLDQPSLLESQIRAILRASAKGPIRIMFPFVTGVEEIRKLKKHVEDVKEQLAAEGVDISQDVPIGAMIELPSAVMMAEELAKEVDFFSIGTNDLTQFTLAVDRGNPRVRSLYQPLHPAVIKMVRIAVKAGKQAGIPVSLCGELGANPTATMLLIGLGLDELSVSPVALPQVKKLIRSMKQVDAVAMAEELSTFETAEDIHDYCMDKMKELFADLPIWFT